MKSIYLNINLFLFSFFIAVLANSYSINDIQHIKVANITHSASQEAELNNNLVDTTTDTKAKSSTFYYEWIETNLGFATAISFYTIVIAFLIRLYYTRQTASLNEEKKYSERKLKEKENLNKALKEESYKYQENISSLKNKIKLTLKGQNPGSNATFIKNRKILQTRLEAIFIGLEQKPDSIYQTLIMNNPIASQSDFLNNIKNENCKITRVIAITRPVDIFFANHSYNLKSKFIGIKNYTYFNPNMKDIEPSYPNFTVVDSHTIISLPYSTSNVEVSENEQNGLLNEGETSGIYINNKDLTGGLSSYIENLGRRADNKVSNDWRIDVLSNEIIEKARNNFWDRAAVGKAEYLADVATVIKTELTSLDEVYQNIEYIGVVGSVASILNAKVAKKINYTLQIPNDLDLVIILRNLNYDHLKKIMKIIDEVCEVYNSSIVKLVPNYSSSPAIYSHNEKEIPIQILFQDLHVLRENWEPYIYCDRLENNIQIIPGRNLPELENFASFTFKQLLEGEDGIKQCIDTIKNKESYGYKWKLKGNKLDKFDAPVKLETDQEKFNFMHYTLYWTFINLTRASDINGFKIEEFSGSGIIQELKAFDNSFVFLPSEEFLDFILAKKYLKTLGAVSTTFNVNEAEEITLRLLNELIRVFSKNSKL